MDRPLPERVAAVAALDEPTRRRLYEHVLGQTGPVSRDEVAAALRLPRTTAAFHLERLVREGLLDVVHERRAGRGGPGAGRPAKLYRRSARQVTVSLPERRYDLVARLLAAALSETEKGTTPPRTALHRRAHRLGAELAAAADVAGDHGHRRTALLRVLREYGYEPRAEGGEIVLANCPYHALAEEHPELVCRMNLHLLDGLLSALGGCGLCARLRPAADHCCVRLEPAGDAPPTPPCP